MISLSEQQTSGRYPEQCFASRGSVRAISVRHRPRQNQLLAALPLEDYEGLASDLEPVPLPLGWTIHDAGGQEEPLYFIASGIVSRICRLENGQSTEFGIAGSEGVIGVASFLGGANPPGQAVVLSAGYAYRLPAHRVTKEFGRGGPLQALLLRYTQAVITHVTQVAACNRHHSVEQQLCRTILSCMDRLPSNDLTLSQQLIADMLGVRRESITEAAQKLREAGLISYRRCHIVLTDRARMEAEACECYAAVKQEYARLLPKYTNSNGFPRAGLAALQP